MSARIAAALLALLLLLGGGAIFYYQKARMQKPAASGTLGQPLLKGLKAAEIAAIVVREPKATLTLERREQGWTIAERAGFPAELDKVRDFVLKMIELKIGQAEPLGAADRNRLNLDDSGTRIEFRAADGKPLAQLVAGRKYFKGEPENPEKALGDGRFVLLPGSESSVYVVSDPLAQASAKSADWIAKTGFAAEKVRTLEVKFPDGTGWKIERARDDAGWKLAGAGPAGKLEITKANAAAYVLANVDLADVLPKGAAPADSGLDKPVLVHAATFDGLSYAIKVGRPAGENYYVSFSTSGTLNRTRTPEKNEKTADKDRRDKEFAERIKKIEERLPREKMLSEYVLLVPKSRLEDTLKKRPELLERKEAKKK